MGLYGMGFILSMIGDQLHSSAESFDWGSHYSLTTSMMIFGFFLAPLACLFSLAVGIVYSIRNNSEQTSGANHLPRFELKSK